MCWPFLHVWRGSKGTSSTPDEEGLESEPYQLAVLTISFSLALITQ